MADSLSVSSVRDPYSFVTRFVKSLEGRIHSNLFSKRGKRQSEEVKRFVDAAATKDLKPLVSTFATSLLEILQQCVQGTHASDAWCRERSYVAFYQAQLRSSLANQLFNTDTKSYTHACTSCAHAGM